MLALLNTLFAYAINGRTTYQARIVKPDGLPLQSSSVNFRFTVLDQSGSCVLFVEDYAAINMTDTSGLISFPLGTGARSFPTSGTAQTFQNTFDNSITSFACQTMGIYNPNSTDTRKIVMQFNDGSGWQTLPAMSINAVPYAMFATRSDNSRALNGKADTAFVEYSALNGLGCAADQAIKYNGVSFSCITVGSSGTAVTSSTVIAALGYTPAQGASFTSLDSTVTSVSSAVYSVSSTVSGLSNSVTSLSSSVAASFAVITSSQWVTSGTSISYSSGNVGIGTSNPVTKLDVSGGVRISMEVATCSASYAGTLRYNSDTVEYCNGTSWLPFGVAGAGVTNVNGSTSGSQTFATGITGTVFNISSANGVHTFNIPLAASSSVVAGLLSNSDYSTFMNKMNATSAAMTSALGYTPANSATVSTLQSDLSTVSAAANSALVKTNNLSDLTNTATARTNLGLGSLAIANGIDLGSASATGTISDARLPNQSGVTSGTQYTKVTVDGKGRVISGSQVTLNDIVHVYTGNGGLFVGSGTSRPLVDDANTAESTAFGVNSMAANQSGGQNTAFGFATLESSVTSYENAAFGWYALQANTTGQFNTAIGAETMWRNTTGVENTAVGGAALQDLTTGNYNSALGMVAGGNIVNGSENVFVGIGAGRGATNANVSKNTIVGGWAGSVINTGSDNNVILGYQSGGNLTTGSSNILIGYNVNATTATASQTLNIGNIIFGSGLNGVGQNISSGSIGIGIKSPTAKLHLASGSASMAPLKFSSGTLLASPQSGTMEYDGTNFYVTDGSNQRRTIVTGSSTGSIDNASTINSSGNITLTPTGSVIVSSTTASTSYNNGALVVQGGVGIVGNLNVAGTISGSAQVKATGYRANQGVPNAADSSTNGYSFGADGDTGIFSPGSGGANGIVSIFTNDVETMRVTLNAVGIGTSAPVARLEVADTAGAANNEVLVSSPDTTTAASKLTLKSGANSAYLRFFPPSTNVASVGADVSSVGNTFQVTNSTGKMVFQSSGTVHFQVGAGYNTKLKIDSSTGNVGINTNSPSTALDVGGLISTGVGTTQIGGLLGSNRGVVPNAGLIVAGNTGSSNGGYAQFYGSNAVSGTDDRRGNVDIGSYSSGGTPGNINFYTYNGSSWLSRMMIQGTTGNIGMGTTTPWQKLDISGSAVANALHLGIGRSMGGYNSISETGTGVKGRINFGADNSDQASIYSEVVAGSVTGLIFEIKDDPTDYFSFNNQSGPLMRIYQDGKVGVGTASPQGSLHIVTAVSQTNSPSEGIFLGKSLGNDYQIQLTQTGGIPHIDFSRGGNADYDARISSPADNSLRLGTTSSSELVTLSGLNVGIGTTAPTSKLSIYSGNDGSMDSVQIHGGSLSASRYGILNVHDTSEYIRLGYYNGTAMKNIFLDGNVGIGTTNPISAKLHLQSGGYGGTPADANNRLKIESSGHSYIGLYSPNTFDQGIHFGDPESEQVGRITYRHSTDMMQFRTNAAERMVIDSSGNVGIGTTSPAEKLDVSGRGRFSTTSAHVFKVTGVGSGYADATDGVATIYSENTAGSGGNILKLGSAFAPNTFVAKDNGNVGIGTTTPSYKLDVNGTIRGFGITDSSDIRLKKNVMPLDLSLEKILQIEGVSYSWIDKERSEKKQIGFIAQQLEKIYPELVETDKQGMKSVNYSHLVAPLVEAFKALYEKVSGVEREIASLKAENEELKSKIKEFDELKAYICKKDPEAPNCKPAQ